MNEILNELLIYEAKEIELFFEKARLEGKGTPQEVSDRREDIVKKLIEKYFPAQPAAAAPCTDKSADGRRSSP